jgi:putative membrane protein
VSDLNDPRVFFAAERTLMAWTRTALALMAFGFVIERFGLFLHMFVVTQGGLPRRDASFWVGVSFIVLGASAALISVLQYRSVLKTLKPVEIPEGYWVNIGVYTNLLLAVFGVATIFYFFFRLGVRTFGNELFGDRR